MSEPIANTNGNGHATTNSTAPSNGHVAKTNGHAHKMNGKAERQDIAALIERAEKLRTMAHDLLHATSSLLKDLKQHRRANRTLESTLASIRQLKGLGV